MRFSFPAAGQVASALEAEVQTQSPEHDIRVADIAAAPAPFLVAVAATEPPDLMAELIATARPPELTPEPVAVAADASTEVAVPEIPEPELQPRPAIQPRPRPKRKVIAFPRQAGTVEAVHRLADPILPEQPRILDVPEELEAFPTTPFLEGLQFEPATQTSAAPSDYIELPFPAVSISQRIYAALVDCSLVATGAVVFALIGHKMLPNLAFTKAVRLTAALVPALLWAIYQYLLLVYSGRTVGMQMAAIRLTTFQGRRPSLRHRRNRVLGLYFSTASLIMGLLWALVDVDALCWHDRLSGTYLTKRE